MIHFGNMGSKCEFYGEGKKRSGSNNEEYERKTFTSLLAQ